jgi:protein-disulfide isomerase
MGQGSSGAAVIAAALIIGGSLAGASYMVSTAIDRGAGEVAALSASLKGALEAAQVVAKAAARPSAAAGPQRPDSQQVYKVEVGSAPTRGPKDAPVTIVEWADFQ